MQISPIFLQNDSKNAHFRKTSQKFILLNGTMIQLILTKSVLLR